MSRPTKVFFQNGPRLHQVVEIAPLSYVELTDALTRNGFVWRARDVFDVVVEPKPHRSISESLKDLARIFGLAEVHLFEATSVDGNEIASPKHYNSHPSGIECVDVVEHMSSNVANVIEYLWRAGLKEGQPLERDYNKALWYLLREMRRLKIGIDFDIDALIDKWSLRAKKEES